MRNLGNLPRVDTLYKTLGMIWKNWPIVLERSLPVTLLFDSGRVQTSTSASNGLKMGMTQNILSIDELETAAEHYEHASHL